MPAVESRQLKTRPVSAQVLSLVVLFLGGGVFGLALAERLAPNSFLASAAGLFAFPLSFAFGMQMWVGTALLTALWRIVRRRPLVPRSDGIVEIPGAYVFVPIAIALKGAAGLVVAIAGSSIGAIATLLLYPTLGTIYGIACWRLARGGYLPLPE